MLPVQVTPSSIGATMASCGVRTASSGCTGEPTAPCPTTSTRD